MNKKMARILRDAANHYLWDGENYAPDDQSAMSCLAVVDAAGDYEEFDWPKISNYLEEFGLNPDGTHEFCEFASGEERQGARFLWLHFAALVSEEL